MSTNRGSRRNPLYSAVLFTVLYILVSSLFYRYYHGRLYFQDFYNFNWFEYVLGAGAMGVCAFLAELVRNRIGRT
ncbi:MAG: hypothetical protein AB1640_25110 [bacterium]